MREKHSITHLPKCYSFSFDIETATIFFKIQKWMLPKMKHYLTGGNSTAEEHQHYDSFGVAGKAFGINQALQWYEETKDELVYSYKLTAAIEKTKKVCLTCNGKKKHSFWDCSRCKGTGRELIESKHHYSQFLLSLVQVLKITNWALLDRSTQKKDTDYSWHPNTTKQQIIALDWSPNEGYANSWVTAWADDVALEWHRQVSNQDIQTIIDAMQKAENILFSTKDKDSMFQFIRLSENRFGLQVPGNACDLTIVDEHGGMIGMIGRSFTPHNIDTRYQQIELVVGFSVINDLVEKFINSKKKIKTKEL